MNLQIEFRILATDQGIAKDGLISMPTYSDANVLRTHSASAVTALFTWPHAARQSARLSISRSISREPTLPENRNGRAGTVLVVARSSAKARRPI